MTFFTDRVQGSIKSLSESQSAVLPEFLCGIPFKAMEIVPQRAAEITPDDDLEGDAVDSRQLLGKTVSAQLAKALGRILTLAFNPDFTDDQFKAACKSDAPPQNRIRFKPGQKSDVLLAQSCNVDLKTLKPTATAFYLGELRSMALDGWGSTSDSEFLEKKFRSEEQKLRAIRVLDALSIAHGMDVNAKAPIHRANDSLKLRISTDFMEQLRQCELAQQPATGAARV